MRSGRKRRMARVMSRRSSIDGVERPVGVPVEELQVPYAERGRGGALLALAQRRHRLSRGVVEAAGVAPRHQEVADLEPVGDPRATVAAGAEVDIVGMGEDAKDPLDVGQRRRGRRKGHPRTTPKARGRRGG